MGKASIAAIRIILPAAIALSACLPSSADGSDTGNTTAEYPGTTADSVIALLVPYMEGHPEALEGNPSTSLTINPGGSGLIAELRQTGFLDDSIRGEEIEAEIEPAASGGWTLVRVARTPLCARGVSSEGNCL